MDPSASGGGGIGKAAQELMQDMQRAQQEVQNKAGAPNEQFQSAMNNTQHVEKTSQASQINPADKIGATQQANNVLMQAKMNAMSPSTRVGETAKAERSKMAEMVEGLVGGQDKMTQIMKLALSGKKFDTQELLAMQAGVYRFSQELDLTGKVIEKATSGVKQTMNTQV